MYCCLRAFGLMAMASLAIALVLVSPAEPVQDKCENKGDLKITKPHKNKSVEPFFVASGIYKNGKGRLVAGQIISAGGVVKDGKTKRQPKDSKGMWMVYFPNITEGANYKITVKDTKDGTIIACVDGITVQKKDKGDKKQAKNLQQANKDKKARLGMQGTVGSPDQDCSLAYTPYGYMGDDTAINAVFVQKSDGAGDWLDPTGCIYHFVDNGFWFAQFSELESGQLYKLTVLFWNAATETETPVEFLVMLRDDLCG